MGGARHEQDVEAVLATLRVPGIPRQVGRARAFTAAVLGGHPCADDAVLVVSELVTNSVLHSASGMLPGGMVTVIVAAGPGEVLVEVRDAGGLTVPAAGDDGELAERGRGLRLVARLAAGRWGHDLDAGGGLRTWCELVARRGPAGSGPALVARLPEPG